MDLNGIFNLEAQQFDIQTNSCDFGKPYEIWAKISGF